MPLGILDKIPAEPGVAEREGVSVFTEYSEGEMDRMEEAIWASGLEPV
jgi:hypothetical protein